MGISQPAGIGHQLILAVVAADDAVGEWSGQDRIARSLFGPADECARPVRQQLVTVPPVNKSLTFSKIYGERFIKSGGLVWEAITGATGKRALVASVRA